MSALEDLARALGFAEAAPILQAMDELYHAVDAELAAAAAGLDLPCKPGCDACCRESVFLSAPEFLVVAAFLLERRPPAERAALVGRMEALAERFADELLLLEELPPGAERDEVAARVRFDCPLLEAEGRCSVYPARELNARTFGHSRDAQRGHPFGCALTHARLLVLPPEETARLVDARQARRRLMAAVPSTERVHVYPWWFARYGRWLLPGGGGVPPGA